MIVLDRVATTFVIAIIHLRTFFIGIMTMISDYYEYVNSLFPESLVFLSGSQALSSNNNQSDIDFICCTKYATYIYSEKIVYKKQILHITFFPKYKLIDYLIHDAFTCGQIYLKMWSQANCLSTAHFPYLCPIQNYIQSLLTMRILPLDDYYYHLIQQIITLCKELEHTTDNQLVIASDLFLSITRFISGKQGGIKHVARSTANNQHYKYFQTLYLRALSTQDYVPFCSSVQKFMSRYRNGVSGSTTGITYNMLQSECIIVFFPSYSHVNVLNDINAELHSELKKVGASSEYVFFIEPNQALDAGLYLYIAGSKKKLEAYYQVLSSYHKRRIAFFTMHNLKMLYPYRTSFSSGLFFGGINNLRMLQPLFCEFYSALEEIIKRSEDLSTPLSASVSVYQAFLNNIPDGEDLLNCIMDRIAIDVVDSVGVYNIEQISVMSSELKKASIKIYEQKYVGYPSLISLMKITEKIIEYVFSLNSNDIFFPNMLARDENHNMLFRNILLHLQDIMMLNHQQRYESLFTFLSDKNKI